jgi:O-antigen/teichoic acid export membrane protein
LSVSLAVLLVIIYKYGATGRMSATVIAGIFPATYCFKKMFGKFQFDIEVIKDALRFGWPLSLAAILWYFLSGIDIAMLEKLKDNHTLGYYNVGMQISGYFAIFYTAIAQTFEPDIYKAIAEDNKWKLSTIIGGIIVLNAIPNIIFICFASFIIGLLTFNCYIESTGFAQIFAVKNIVVSFYYCAIIVLVGYGFTKTKLLILIIGSFISFFVYKTAIFYYGFYGAAWGQIISLFILSFIIIIFLTIKLRISKNKNYVLKN